MKILESKIDGLLVAFLTLFTISSAVAQTDWDYGQLGFANTSTFSIDSKIVDDDPLIYLGLPRGYDSSGETKYPVVYLTDANYKFALFYSIYGMLSRDGLPEMIVVGIGYQTDTTSVVMNNRARDFSPVRDIPRENRRGVPLTGEASKYSRMIQEELIPYIDENYNTDSNKIYAGSSDGGLFGVYLLLTTDNVFSSYIIGSPNIEDYTLERELDYSKVNTKLNANVILTAGSEEANYILPHTATLYDQLSSRGYSGLNVEFHVVPESGHESSVPMTFLMGLKFIAEHLEN